MSLPKKEELVKELKAVIEGVYEKSAKEVKEEAEKIKENYIRRVNELASSVSL